MGHFSVDDGFDIFVTVFDITGGSRELRHQGWSDVSAFAGGTVANAGDPRGGGASVSLISFVKAVDKASPRLLQELAGGHSGIVEIDVCKRSSELNCHLQYKLENAVLADVSMVGSVESIAIAFTKITVTFTTQKPDGSPGSKTTFEFDSLAPR
jgi:type VI secretion system secreted protein Hcp